MVDQPGQQGQVLPRYAQMPPGVSSLIDMHVGKRLRQRRSLLGLSQENLGEAVGVTFQQIQKYEKGSNRVSASKLADIAKFLNISVASFFEGSGLEGKDTTVLPYSREALKIAEAFDAISDPRVKTQLRQLTKILAD